MSSKRKNFFNDDNFNNTNEPSYKPAFEEEVKEEKKEIKITNKENEKPKEYNVEKKPQQTNKDNSSHLDLVDVMKEVQASPTRTSIMLSQEQLAALDLLSSITDTKGKISGIIRKALTDYCIKLKKTDRETYDMVNMMLNKKLKNK